MKSNEKKERIAVWYPDKFPSIDSPKLDSTILLKSIGKYEKIIIKSIEELNSIHKKDSIDLFILPFGSAFPVQGWETIKRYIHSGGNLLVLGGKPFYTPVYFKNGEWLVGTSQPTYAHDLLVGPAEEIKINSDEFYNIKSIKAFDEQIKDFPKASKVFALTYRFSINKDIDNEFGSAGTREAFAEPLVHYINNRNIPFVAPIVKIDRYRSYGAGGRWIFVPCDAELNQNIISRCIEIAIEGASEVSARPIWASYHEGEMPVVRVQLYKPDGKYYEKEKAKHTIKIFNKASKEIYDDEFVFSGKDNLKIAEVPIKIKNMKPGYYTAEINLNCNLIEKKYKTGFWIKDESFLSNCPKVTVTKDWLKKGNEIYPVTGTTYMASDVHRKFLFEPNPEVWKNDFKQMSSLGVNFVRTGLWTGFYRVMLNPGAIDEGVLRALEAYVMTAAENNVLVCFNYFAFSPPLFSGINPYLDPVSLEGQKRLLSLIANRFKGCNWIHYDLINEPSYSPQNEIWQNVPVKDHYEKQFWTEWVHRKFNNDEDLMRDSWLDISNDIYSVPYSGELYYSQLREYKRFRKGMDFQLFTQDMVTNWAKNLADALKDFGMNPLVTLGQDEGGNDVRPQPQFYYKSLDYTSIHTWWMNDDLLWDGLASKVLEKPNMVQETGLMRLENIDGEHWRTPEKAENILRRKFALAFAGRAAGIIEWAWNINPYMPIDNESVIGFIRPDGTTKIELRSLLDFADFFKKCRKNISDYEKPEVAVIIPNSKIFSARQFGNESTKRFVRLLSDYYAVTPLMISEYNLSAERLEGIKLVILPCPEMLCDSAAKTIKNLSEKGVKVLLTGSLEGNAYGKKSKEVSDLNITTESAPVELREVIPWQWNDEFLYATFDAGKREILKKAINSSQDMFSTNIIHELLPLELAREDKPLLTLLKKVMDFAKVPYTYSEMPMMVSILKMKNGNYLVSCVNESSSEIERNINIESFAINVKINSDESAVFLINGKNGKILEQCINSKLLQKE